MHKSTSTDIYRYISKVRKTLSNQIACRKTFQRKNIVRYQHDFKYIKNKNGTVLYEKGDQIIAKYKLIELKSKNISLDYDSSGNFVLNFKFEKLGQDHKKKYITTQLTLEGTVDSKGQVLSCYVDDDGFFVKSLKAACRKLE